MNANTRAHDLGKGGGGRTKEGRPFSLQFRPFDFRFRAFSTSRTRLSQSLEQVTNEVEHTIPKTN